MGPLLFLLTMEKMHNFYHANTFINFPDIYRWTLLLFTTRLLFKYLLWWTILCVSLSLHELFLRPYYNLCWMQPRPWAKVGFSHFCPYNFHHYGIRAIFFWLVIVVLCSLYFVFVCPIFWCFLCCVFVLISVGATLGKWIP